MLLSAEASNFIRS